jgi:hypothetical protein
MTMPCRVCDSDKVTWRLWEYTDIAGRLIRSHLWWCADCEAPAHTRLRLGEQP